jgi:hypothetical protein
MNAAQAVFGDERGEGVSMPRPAHKTRQDWLGSLRVGSSVNLVTPCGIHSAVVERYEVRKSFKQYTKENFNV